MKAFKVIGIAIFRDRNLGFEVLGLCNFKCYHYVLKELRLRRTVLGLCNYKCYHITAELLTSGLRASD